MVGPDSKNTWMTVGVVVKPGENNFASYDYSGGEGFGFNLTYDGYTQINGTWESPGIFLGKANDLYNGISSYVSYLYELGYSKKIDRSNSPKWWKQPIFGGWGEQCYLSSSWKDYFSGGRKGRSGSSSENCTRDAYECMLSQLEENGIDPKILIIDNRWFKTDDSLEVDECLWPDMKGFIREQHDKNRKVILWVSPFSYHRSDSGKNVPIQENLILDKQENFSLEIDTDVFYSAMGRQRAKIRKPPKQTLDEDGWQFVVDPLNKAYETRLRHKVEYLLSPNHLDADGFEFDYLHFVPAQRGLVPVTPRDESIWGIEFLHRLLWIYYDQSKKTKSDSLIITHTFNPYFNDVVDMLRLNDFYTDNNGVVDQMHHRARIARISCPNCCVHTDQHPMPNLKAWREYAKFQPLIGNPVLYYVTGMETTLEKFTKQDYIMLQKIWSEYESNEDKLYAPKA